MTELEGSLPGVMIAAANQIQHVASHRHAPSRSLCLPLRNGHDMDLLRRLLSSRYHPGRIDKQGTIDFLTCTSKQNVDPHSLRLRQTFSAPPLSSTRPATPQSEK